LPLNLGGLAASKEKREAPNHKDIEVALYKTVQDPAYIRDKSIYEIVS
jgi:hypothetical protein